MFIWESCLLTLTGGGLSMKAWKMASRSSSMMQLRPTIFENWSRFSYKNMLEFFLFLIFDSMYHLTSLKTSSPIFVLGFKF